MKNTKKTIDTKKTLWYSNINKNKENFVIKWMDSHYKIPCAAKCSVRSVINYNSR